MRRTSHGLAVLATAAVAAGGEHARAGTAELTASGVGRVDIGDTYRSLHNRDLLGPLRPGCAADGPRSRKAGLRGGLKGTVFLSKSRPRRVEFITVRAGAAAGGVGFGDRRADIRRTFPHTKFNSGAQEPFGLTLAQVPERDGGPFQFGVDVDSKRITRMGVPGILLC